MYRRRRRTHEIAFSFDAFLDVVANVVGIILRLILVAWVGARSYQAVVPVTAPPTDEPVAAEEMAELPEPTDPRTEQLPQRRRELAAQQAKLAAEQAVATDAERQAAALAAQLASAAARRQQLEMERAALARTLEGKDQTARSAAAALAPLQERARQLQASLDELKKVPTAKQVLRWRTPVSQPLQTEELLFECREGRVTLIDIGALLEEARKGMRDKSELLRRQWVVEEDTKPIGAFRLHFSVERERGALEASGATPPDERGNFRYGLSSWRVDPVDFQRGETVEQALAPGSAFRRIVDAVDASQTAVTFWVYPDSFDAYRRLRDVLHERDVVVAGRPLPVGTPIAASSKRGTVSRGQ